VDDETYKKLIDSHLPTYRDELTQRGLSKAKIEQAVAMLSARAVSSQQFQIWRSIRPLASRLTRCRKTYPGTTRDHLPPSNSAP